MTTVREIVEAFDLEELIEPIENENPDSLDVHYAIDRGPVLFYAGGANSVAWPVSAFSSYLRALSAIYDSDAVPEKTVWVDGEGIKLYVDSGGQDVDQEGRMEFADEMWDGCYFTGWYPGTYYIRPTNNELQLFYMSNN